MSFVLTHPLTPLVLTLLVYYSFSKLANKTGQTILFNPPLWTILICIAVVRFSDMEYQLYKDSTYLIHFLLGPVTVALAVPLYKQIPLIKKYALPILISVFAGCIVASGSAWLIASAMGANQDIQLSILSKSVTVPIAIEIADIIKTVQPLAILFVYMTGIPGALIALWLYRSFKLQNEAALGLAMGVTSHGFGTAFAFGKSEMAGSFAALGMSLMGIISGVILPIAVYAFLK